MEKVAARTIVTGFCGFNVDHFGLVDPEGHITSFQLYQNLAANMLLVPGSYTATAMAEQLDPSFRINAGETRDIMLGN